MTKEEAKELLPIIQAYTEGKIIECSADGKFWSKTDTPKWKSGMHYRIKPKQKYRAFESQEECWNEMMKHQPFGWVTNICIDQKFYITHVGDDDMMINSVHSYFRQAFKDFTFVDGSPFGIKIKN